MAWTAPWTATAGHVVTASEWNTYIRDNQRAQRGLDGVVTIESGLIIDSTGGDEYLQIPSLTTIERNALTPAAGMLIYNETTTQFNKYENGAWRADLGFNSHHGDLSGLTDDDHTQYQLKSLLTTQGDMVYATAASTWARLAKGTAGQALRMNVGATAPEWVAGIATMQIHVPCFTGTGGSVNSSFGGYTLTTPTDLATMAFRVPNDFITLTSVKIILLIGGGTGTFDWTVNTTFGANGEAYNIHTDSATADGQAGTQNQWLELDISAAFTGLAANDIANVQFVYDAEATMTQVIVVGLDFKYT